MKVKSLFFSILSSVLLASCSPIIVKNSSTNGTDFEPDSSLCGSVTVVNSDGSRALDISSIKYCYSYVSGDGITLGKEPSSTDVVSDGKSESVTITGIKAGNNRIITVYAMDSEKNKIGTTIIRAIADVKAGENTEVCVNWESTALGNVFYYLYSSQNVNISLISSSDIQKIKNAIPAVHSCLVDAEQIAIDYKEGNLKESSSYVLTPATLKLTYDKYPSYSIQVCDPISAVKTGCTGETNIVENIAPGIWPVYVFNGDEVVAQFLGKFTSDAETEKILTTITDKIIVHVYDYTHIYAYESESNKYTSDWPGDKMEEDVLPGWYTYTLNYKESYIIFSYGGSSQSSNGDLITAGEWWFKDRTWYSEDPSDTTPPKIENVITSQTGQTVTGINRITVKASDNLKLSYADFYIKGGTITEEKFLKRVYFSELTEVLTYDWDSTVYKNNTYTILITVYDAQKNKSETYELPQTTLNENLKPVAVITGSSQVALGKTKSYSALNSYDLNGSVVSYKWTVSNNAELCTENTSGTVSVKFPSSTSECTLTLTVTDDDGESSTTSKKITVKELKGVDFREETIYFAMTTRFYDGDTSNNVHCWDENANTPADDPAWRGDFKGLIQKLDYIKALGFSAVWITPVVENCSGLDYHGYHAMNFSKVDPRYESDDVDFQTLIDEVHSRDMKLVLDVVFNHTGNFGEATLCPMFEKDYSADLEDINACLKLCPGSLLDDSYYNLTAGAQYAKRLAMMKNTDYVNHDIHNYYHHFGFGNWDDFTAQFMQIAGDCVDLNTENPKVLNYIVDAYSKYIEMGVDAFRIDTGKHISRLSFNQVLNDAFIEAAAESGNDGFYMFSEICARSNDVTYRGNVWNASPYFYTWKDDETYSWSNSDTEQFEGVIIYPETEESGKDEERIKTDLDYFTRETEGGGTATPCNALAAQRQGIDTTDVSSSRPTSTNHQLEGNNYHTPDYTRFSGLNVIDFPMHWNFNNASGAFGVHGSDNLYNDATWNVVYVDSHDYGPSNKDKYRYDGGTDAWAENISLMFTFRGIPCLYYGSEVEFMAGKVIDEGPNIPLCETGRAYFGEALEGTVTASDFSVYTASGTVADTLEKPLCQHIMRLNKIRRAIPALQKGQYSTENCSGSMSFKRRFTDAEKSIDSFVLVTISGDSSFSGIPGGKYVDVITGDTKTVNEGDSLTATCSGQGNARIYVLQNATATEKGADGKIGEDTDWLK